MRKHLDTLVYFDGRYVCYWIGIRRSFAACDTAVHLLSAKQRGLEKRLDALVQMARISGDVVGVDEISQPLAQGPRAEARSNGELF